MRLLSIVVFYVKHLTYLTQPPNLPKSSFASHSNMSHRAIASKYLIAFQSKNFEL